jgi:Pvc16 N-terminal domain
VADQTAIAAVSRTLRALLRDRMVGTPAVTFAPPDVVPTDVGDARVNLYLIHVIENAELKNQESPFTGSAYGRLPLSLNLRYLMTTYPGQETLQEADLNAQGLLGDAMRVFHDFGNRIDTLTITNSVAGTIGDPILDPALSGEFERLRLTLQPASIDDLTKIWSALSEANFRRSVIYEVTVVQIETREPRVLPLPVQQRRILATLLRRPVIEAAYVTPPPGQPRGELRARIGEQITIEAAAIAADKLYVRLGTLDPIRVSAAAGQIRIVVPDDTYPMDLDNPSTRPIPASQQLQPGPLPVQLLAQVRAEGVEGGLDHGSAVTTVQVQRHASNIALLQLVPQVAGVAAPGTVLAVTGTRLWHPAAHTVEVVIGDAAVPVRAPEFGDLWAAPTPTKVEIPLADAAAMLPVQAAIDPPYPVAVEVDGARSRDAVGFHLGP